MMNFDDLSMNENNVNTGTWELDHGNQSQLGFDCICVCSRRINLIYNLIKTERIFNESASQKFLKSHDAVTSGYHER